jgi:hypothetical protein
MSKKVNWADVDKRIRNRKKDFSTAEVREIEDKLMKLPDLAEHVDIVDIVQPAVAPPEVEATDEADSAGEEPN